MSPWTALLESLHSALIDELNERFPNEKPELGMPKRLPKWGAPAPDISQALIHSVKINDQLGIALLALDTQGEAGKKIDLDSLWKGILNRAGSEFSRRGIRPHIGSGKCIQTSEALPSSIQEPTRWVWIPFKISAGTCFLGIAA